MNRTIQVLTHWLSPLLTLMMGVGVMSVAQAQLPPAQPAPTTGGASSCQPPQPDEFLLLVVTRTPDSQTQVKQLFPPNTSIQVCNYLNDTVTRVGGFRTLDRANAWARYMAETTGLAAFVARPAELASAASPPKIPPSTSSQTGSASTKPASKPAIAATSDYNPKPLGPGYAVLVDYGNQPEMAAKVQQLVGQDVGLVSYGQSPFLLALYTSDANAAYATLQKLSDRGFWATLVDSRRVILLRQPVARPRSVS